MKRARSAMSCSTSAWCCGGTLTVVIWVTASLFSRISGMCVLLLVRETTRVPGCSFRFLDAVGLTAARLDRLRDGDRASRHVGVEPLDHAALEPHDALVPVLRQVEGRDDLFRLRDLFRVRR